MTTPRDLGEAFASFRRLVEGALDIGKHRLRRVFAGPSQAERQREIEKKTVLYQEGLFHLSRCPLEKIALDLQNLTSSNSLRHNPLDRVAFSLALERALPNFLNSPTGIAATAYIKNIPVLILGFHEFPEFQYQMTATYLNMAEPIIAVRDRDAAPSFFQGLHLLLEAQNVLFPSRAKNIIHENLGGIERLARQRGGSVLHAFMLHLNADHAAMTYGASNPSPG